MAKVPVLAFIALLFFVGCESEDDSTREDYLLQEHAQELIPLGYNNAWTYRVQWQFGSNGEVQAATETETSRNVGQFIVDQTITVWDSLTSSWVYAGMGPQFIHDGWRYLSTRLFAYTPYHQGSEKGLLCGFDLYNGAEGRYWFKLPRKPAEPLSFRIKEYEYHSNRTPQDTTWSQYTATLDTNIYSIEVAAGRFDCYKLQLFYEAEIAVGGEMYSYDTNTVYLSPGVGVVKRRLAKRSVVHYDPTDSSELGKEIYTYELLKFEH